MRRKEVNLVPATRRSHRRRAFSMVELLTALGIIVVLMALAIPAVNKVRRTAQTTTVRAQLASLQQAIEAYHVDHKAYPGPVANTVIGTSPNSASADFIDYNKNDNTGFPSSPTKSWSSPPKIVDQLTGTENLVLGLLGGLRRDPNNVVVYEPTILGQGPASLNQGVPKKYGNYVPVEDLTDGFFVKTGTEAYRANYTDPVTGAIDDTPIPEILDRYPNRMPILYLRANVAANRKNPSGPNPPTNDLDNPVVVDSSNESGAFRSKGSAVPVVRLAQYDIYPITAYVKAYNNKTIGEGKTAVTGMKDATSSGGTTEKVVDHGLVEVGVTSVLDRAQASGSRKYNYPYPAYPYFKDPNSPETAPVARQKDGYILISAGLDRIYGTDDDITNFGDVKP